MGNSETCSMASNWGDVRHTQADYQNNDLLKLTVPSNGASLDASDLDREYCYKMRQIGLQGLLTMEKMSKLKLEQKSLQSGLASLRRAFEPYDHDGTGSCNAQVFRKALEVFGLQFTEDQVSALFGYYDKGRQGTISYYKWMNTVSQGEVLPTQKGWDAGLQYAERENKWAKLEQQWEQDVSQDDGSIERKLGQVTTCSSTSTRVEIGLCPAPSKCWNGCWK